MIFLEGKKELLWKNTTIAFTVFLIIKLHFKDWPKTSRHITIKIRLKYFLKKKKLKKRRNDWDFLKEPSGFSLYKWISMNFNWWHETVKENIKCKYFKIILFKSYTKFLGKYICK